MLAGWPTGLLSTRLLIAVYAGLESLGVEKVSEEHKNIANRDWRLQAVTTLAKDFRSPFTGEFRKAGSPVELAGFVQYGKSRLLARIPVPSASAIYVSLARKAAELGANFINQEFSRNLEPLPDGNTQYSPNAEKDLFDALENMIVCIVFSYTAIEVFANQTIPDDFQFKQERSDGKCKEIYSKEQIERSISLDTKLDVILPGIFSVPSPKGKGVWNDYVWLKRLRDRLVHLKSSDCTKSGPDNAEDYVWTWLLSTKVLKAPRFALAMIEHYHPNEKPRWIRKFTDL